MKLKHSEQFYQALHLVSQIDEKFIELGSHLRYLQENEPEEFRAPLSQPQLGRRRATTLLRSTVRSPAQPRQRSD